MLRSDILTPEDDEWNDWQHQLKHGLSTYQDFDRYFPDISDAQLNQIRKHRGMNTHIPPYLARQFKTKGGDLDPKDPLVKQFVPGVGETIERAVDASRDIGEVTDLFEEERQVSDIIDKEDDAPTAVVRSPACLGLCPWCLEGGRTLDPDADYESPYGEAWEESVNYLRNDEDIREVIFSGGDPLAMKNQSLEQMLSDVHSIDHVKSIRLHTRAFTFNPFRIDDGLIDLLRDYEVTDMAFNLAHPRELNGEARQYATNRIRDNTRTDLVAHMPLLRGVNDDVGTMARLHNRMREEHGITPYYLVHALPNTPGGDDYRTSVRKGVKMKKAMDRKLLPGRAMSTYICVTESTKLRVPLRVDGTSWFRHTFDEEGNPIIRYKHNGTWREYADANRSQTA